MACYQTLYMILDLNRFFGIWNGRTLYRPGSMKTVATELGKEQGVFVEVLVLVR
jgi:hypothetical protein